MAICSGRRGNKPYYDSDSDIESMCKEWEQLWFESLLYGLKWRENGRESWKKFNDLSSKMVADSESWKKFNDSSSKMIVDNTCPPIFYLDWINFDDQKES